VTRALRLTPRWQPHHITATPQSLVLTAGNSTRCTGRDWLFGKDGTFNCCTLDEHFQQTSRPHSASQASQPCERLRQRRVLVYAQQTNTFNRLRDHTQLRKQAAVRWTNTFNRLRDHTQLRKQANRVNVCDNDVCSCMLNRRPLASR
jgi:hypothetical protein